MFEIPERTVTIEIPSGEFAGAEVVANRNIPLSLVLEIDQAMVEGGSQGMVRAVRAFADNILIGWNLAQKGQAIPATAEEMLRLPPDLVLAILAAWGDVVKGVNVPLDEPSPDGGPSAEA